MICYTIATDMLHRIIHFLISHFVPHEGNDFAPRLLRRGAMIMMLGLVLLSFVMTNMQALLWQSSDWLVGAILPAVVVDLTNKERSVNAAPQLVRNAVLDTAAMMKAEDMAKNSYFSHDSPTGVTPWHWFTAAGYPFVHAGENLAVYFTDSSEVVDAWMASPGHRANIVNADYREIGIGTARGKYNGYDTIFVVQLFGTPAVAAPVIVPKVVAAAPVLTEPTISESETVLALADTQTVAVATARADAEESRLVTQVPQVAGESADSAEVEVAAPATTVAKTSIVSPVVLQDVPPQPVVQEPLPPRTSATDVQDNYVSLYSDLAASSTDLTPASIAGITGTNLDAPLIARLAVEPNRTLQLVYLIIGALTVLALCTSVLLEWRQHRPRETVYGIGLLVLMCCLFYIHSVLAVGVVIG